MRLRRLLMVALFGGLACSTSTTLSAAESWTKIEAADEIKLLLFDKMLDGKYWKFYFRSDGKMAYEQSGFASVREWKIDANGSICMNIYSMPDKSLGCETLLRADGSNKQYRLEGATGNSEIQILQPDPSLVEAVLNKAGPVK